VKVIGMWDSPYVRRVVVSAKLMGLPLEADQVSVFRHFDRFAAVNPVVKAPTLVCDDGAVLMDSTLICDYLDMVAGPARALMPVDHGPRREALRLVGLALAATEKAVQIVYERDNRPPETRHQPWLDRVVRQANTAFGLLEAEAARASPWLQGAKPNAADVALACAWRFGQFYDAAEIPAVSYPALAAYSARAEALPAFASTPLD
jgi:glutathione S-transferase